MLRTVWYFLKISLVLGIAVYLSTLQGELKLEWNDYAVSVQMGFVAVSAFLGFLLLVVASGVAYRIFTFPERFSLYLSQRRHAKGYQALLRSLTAAALGDQKNARYLAVRAQKFLPESEAGLPLLLQAQAMRGLGDTANRDQPYELLLKNAETALLGLHGLVQNAILAGDFSRALSLARDAVKVHPKNYALLKTVYDLELRCRLWNDALITLDRAVKAKVIDKSAALDDRAALYCTLGDMAKEGARAGEALEFYKKAFGVRPDFIPAVQRLCQFYIDTGLEKKALSILTKAWKANAHPDLVPLWARLRPVKKNTHTGARYNWFDYVAKFHPNSIVAVTALAQAAIDDGLWGEARAALARAEKISPTQDVYKLWVTLEEQTSNRAEVIRQWLDRASTAPKSGAWVCTKTGRSIDQWVPVIEPEGLFNTLRWDALAARPELISAQAA